MEQERAELMNTMNARAIFLSAVALAGAAALATARPGMEPASSSSPESRGIGPDVITGTVANTYGSYDMHYYGQSGGIGGFSFATQSCNIGDQDAMWFGGTSDVPTIIMNAYRFKDGVFEQIGLAWMKHSFCALSENESYCGNCTAGHDCDWLATGCADTYSSGLNGDAVAPRTDINPSTGEYPYPFSISPSGSGTMRGKLQIDLDKTDPSQNSGARYFLEGYYMSPDDTAAGNHMNNASFREVNFNSSTNTSPVAGTERQKSAMFAWKAVGGGVTLKSFPTEEADGSGLVYLGYKATDLGAGWYHYQYAVQNLNSHRGVQSFNLEVPDCIEVENFTFTDVDYHSGEGVDGTDWEPTHANGTLTWSTETYNQNVYANAIRWGSMYTFGFDANRAPDNGEVSMDYWRSGPDAMIIGTIGVPWDDCQDCSSDINGDGITNVDDLLGILAFWGHVGEHPSDVNGDLLVNVDDLLIIIGGWGPCG